MTIIDPSSSSRTPSSDASPVQRLLHALRVYQAAENAMRRRIRRAMPMGENELLTLRLLLGAQADRRTVTPTEVAKYLGVSTASTTALIDRLETAGQVVRTPHPTDRRSLKISATDAGDAAVRATLAELDDLVLAEDDDLDTAQVDWIVALLDRLTRAVDEVPTVHF